MKKIFVIATVVLSVLNANAQFSVSDNHRFLLRDGKPFCWIGDTGWELFHRLTVEQTDYYFTRRSAQGFTVVQAVILAEFDGLHTPNAYGELPLFNDDPTKPNEAYFKIVDSMIDKAALHDITIALLPTWGDKVFLGGWGTGPVIFTAANAKIYGEWLSKRYKNKKNIIWILGGDRNPQNQEQVEIWRSMANGIESGLAGAVPIISYHCQPNEQGSGEWFYNDSWFSFNMFQNGHCRDGAGYEKITASYNRSPVKPVIDGEPLYEDHPICFNANDLGTSSAYDVRKYAYTEVFAGAFGHTYGCHDIWQFYSPYRPAVNGPHVYWQQALELPGANQMKYLRRLLLSRPFADRIPDQSVVVENNLAAAERIQATRGKDFVFVYDSKGLPFVLVGGKISGKTIAIHWFNPRNGEIADGGMKSNSGNIKLIPPSSGYGQDWVLIADDDNKHYALP